MNLLEPALYFCSFALVLIGIAGAILPMLPGIPMVFGGLWLAAWVDHYQHVGAGTLVVIAILGAIGMALDFVAGALGAQRVGASKGAIIGAFIGTIVGMFMGLFGLIVGPFAGALVGELASGSSALRSTHVSIATWIGMLLGTLAKLVLSFIMVGVFISMFII